ncbi:hypothetical protein A2U01_0085814, partial [Trifolium medium]|nr:hypothetical protein [Trifolium medium]
SWSLPPKHGLKLNVDAHPLDVGHWGLGLVLRGDDGRCVGAATRICKGSECVAMAEALGLSEGMAWIEKLHIQNVTIEMDAETIV